MYKRQAEHRQRHKLTIDDILQELEDARQKALKAETPQCSAAISATMSKAKLLGLDKPGVKENPLTAFIASIQGSSIKVMQQCDVDNYEDEDNTDSAPL